MRSFPSIAFAAVFVVLAACVSGNVRWETAHPIEIREASWSTSQAVSVTFVNPHDFDLCIQSYLWPVGTPAADVLIIRDQGGRVAPFIGDEPVVIGGSILRVHAESSRVVNIDLRQAYDTSDLLPPVALEYSAVFHEC